jgi:calcium-dependent protein kinase
MRVAACGIVQVKKILGEGASCKVMAVKERSSSRYFAMKVLDKSEPYNRTLFENETQILNTLRHENILELVDAYEDKRTYNLLTVLYQGGELFDRVKNGSFSEKVAARLSREMLRAVAYCHRHSIVHRDLKPENFVFESPAEDSAMKLIDFGCAKIVKDDDSVPDVAGSPYYCAPEVLSETFNRTGRVWKAADLWSVGVIIFLLVCGYPPFNGESQDQIFKKIKKGKYRFPKTEQGIALSDSVKELIDKLLRMEPAERLSAQQALEHPWISGDVAPDTQLAVVDSLMAFRNQCRLKKAVARVLANRITEDDKAALADVFRKFDANGDGQLGPDEIRKMMMHLGKNEGEAKEMFEVMDEDKSGAVSIEEFTTGAMMGRVGASEAEMKKAFEIFDLDGDGFVSMKEIERVCNWLSPEAVAGLVKEVDQNGDGKINFNEWIKAMGDLNTRIPGATEKKT